MARERWKPVVGYEGIYSVSDRGKVRREVSRTCAKAGTILKMPLRNGYPVVSLCGNGKATLTSVHVIVLAAFVGQRPDGLVINHKDAKRTNNRLSNLEYATQSHNVFEAYRLKRRDCRGEGNGQSILTADQVKIIRKTFTGMRGEQASLARKYGVSPSAIRGITSGRAWAHV